MTTEGGLERETFNHMAKVAGLDVNDTAHMDELYSYVQVLLPSLKSLNQLDLSSVEPATIYVPTGD